MKAIYHGISQESDDAVIERLLHPPTNIIAVDTETISTKDQTCIGIGIAINPNEAYYIPIWPQPSEILLQVYDLLTRKDIIKLGHNYNFDIASLRDFAFSNNLPDVDVWSIQDTAIMANVSALPAGLHDLGTKLLGNYELFTIQDLLEEAKQETGKSKVNMLDVDQRRTALKCCNDVKTTYGIYEILNKKLTGKTRDCYEIDRHLTGILKTIELSGIALNQEELNKHYQDLIIKCEVYEDWAYEQGFNIGSPAQVGMYLATNGVFLPFTESGRQYDTSEEVLSRYSSNSVVSDILEYRKNRKLLSTYIEPFLNKSRGYTHFRLDLATGRLASYDRNFQNIPPEMRVIFRPDNGVFTWADMSQLEMRVFAYLTQDKYLLELYRQGASVHNATFKAFYPDKPRYLDDGKDSPYYVKAKTGNFAMIFNANDNTIASQCEISISEAKRFKNTWFELHPEAKDWMELQIAIGSDEAETIFGRRMRIPKERGKHHADTCRINYPTQGSGADINKRSMVAAWNSGFLTKENFRLQVHDEIVLDGAYKDSFPHDLITNIHPEISIPWEVKEGPVWI